jgi:hypothetical protein
MAITYGLTAEEADANVSFFLSIILFHMQRASKTAHQYIDHAEKTMFRVTSAIVPGKYIVDIFPSRKCPGIRYLIKG